MLRDGYFLVEDLLTPEECEAHIARLGDYAHGRREPAPGMQVQREPMVERGEREARPGEDVRKIRGAAGDDLFRELACRPAIVGAMQELMGSELELLRADVLMKPAGVGSPKGVHQDSPYWPIEPMDLWSCWLAFDNATEDNGCMAVVPGTHEDGALPHVKVTDDMIVPEDHYDPAALIKVPMRAGTGLFFHSLLLHGTAENRSALPRRAITMSYMPAGSTYTGNPPRPDYLKVS